jgi:hypothetical protein
MDGGARCAGGLLLRLQGLINRSPTPGQQLVLSCLGAIHIDVESPPTSHAESSPCAPAESSPGCCHEYVGVPQASVNVLCPPLLSSWPTAPATWFAQRAGLSTGQQAGQAGTRACGGRGAFPGMCQWPEGRWARPVQPSPHWLKPMRTKEAWLVAQGEGGRAGSFRAGAGASLRQKVGCKGCACRHAGYDWLRYWLNSRTASSLIVAVKRITVKPCHRGHQLSGVRSDLTDSDCTRILLGHDMPNRQTRGPVKGEAHCQGRASGLQGVSFCSSSTCGMYQSLHKVALTHARALYSRRVLHV